MVLLLRVWGSRFWAVLGLSWGVCYCSFCLFSCSLVVFWCFCVWCVGLFFWFFFGGEVGFFDFGTLFLCWVFLSFCFGVLFLSLGLMGFCYWFCWVVVDFFFLFLWFFRLCGVVWGAFLVRFRFCFFMGLLFFWSLCVGVFFFCWRFFSVCGVLDGLWVLCLLLCSFFRLVWFLGSLAASFLWGVRGGSLSFVRSLLFRRFSVVVPLGVLRFFVSLLRASGSSRPPCLSFFLFPFGVFVGLVIPGLGSILPWRVCLPGVVFLWCFPPGLSSVLCVPGGLARSPFLSPVLWGGSFLGSGGLMC